MRNRSDREQTTSLLLVLLCVGVLLVMGLLAGPDEQDLEARRYCEMVALYRADPSTGWPDYKGTFRTSCTAAGLVRP